ncbi:ShlB/FhaC/HecB family hemolysin secretion/activation protein [Rhodoplanes sp. TEM]|uniref:ShlB/FhaC/HecB family hemolysin secretion/activation protein n=1 Tax=Rhodoplanes tepidamans TaxID=200616 RepID=A0ABT5JBK9_RHOTP|nr:MULTISPECIES: ShlB/FhaC/HecB family hemolysin secretion/activation protein [Rhodoplanes]MDC7787019.1 ShlB/FhaC/HecB family hemolysin secretion/activation protein [Rhodoplanes tepidamans]MDC7986971.1 ShlB/FhaC/HecB family hemolysin secretion/activation protein [Rhodoplanes sp. TEM]MDQ0354256.1 hemolysin activation/secretion protein [Rhodoplanes tepidamans]
MLSGGLRASRRVQKSAGQPGRTERRAIEVATALAAALAACPPAIAAPERGPEPPAATSPESKRPARFDIDEFEIRGADALAQIDIEEVLYPFTGSGKSGADVEKARAALEKAYHDRGLQTVGVAILTEEPAGGVVVLKVTEQKVGQLRVNGSRFFDIDRIKRTAPSVQEGKLPNFNDISRDIVRLNQWPDRRVTPALRAGVSPGTVDIDLNVEDKLPLHATVEVNNRQSPNTRPLRTTATVRYDNLWQLGHSASFTYQVAPQAPDQVEVFSGSYLWRPTFTDRFNLLFYGVKSKSSVATIGGINVVGPGEILGSRAVITLPGFENFFHTLSAGIDYKHFDQTTELGGVQSSSPVTYWPGSVNYNATWQRENSLTQLGAGLVYGFRGLGSDYDTFDIKRYKATAAFTVLKGDLTQTFDLPGRFQAYGKVQGQISDQPLVSSEQFSLGGLDTVRGYLESETVGDYGVAGTVELRTPDIAGWFRETFKPPAPPPKPFDITMVNELRLFAFGDAGFVRIHEPLPEQQQQFDLASYGFGTRFRVFDYFNGSVAYAMPVIGQTYTTANNPRVLFRFWGEF